MKAISKNLLAILYLSIFAVTLSANNIPMDYQKSDSSRPVTIKASNHAYSFFIIAPAAWAIKSSEQFKRTDISTFSKALFDANCAYPLEPRLAFRKNARFGENLIDDFDWIFLLKDDDNFRLNDHTHARTPSLFVKKRLVRHSKKGTLVKYF